MPLKKLLFIDSFKYIAAAAAVSAKATQIFHVLNSVSGLFSRLPASINTKPSAPRKINVGTCPSGMNRSAMQSKPPPIPHASFLGKRIYKQYSAHAANIAGKNQSAPMLQRKVSINRSPSAIDTERSTKCLYRIATHSKNRYGTSKVFALCKK